MPAAAIAVTSLAVGVYQGNKAANAQEAYQNQSAAQQRKVAAIQGAKERKETARAARIRRGQVINASAQSGTMNSSSATSALGNIAAQAKEDIKASFTNQAIGSQSSNLQSKAARYSANANAAMSIASFATSQIAPSAPKAPAAPVTP